ILMDRGNRNHIAQAEQNNIREIDLVVVNLYPFADTIAQGVSLEDCIEKIDIGGPSLLRAAAKNSEHVCVLCDPQDYEGFVEELHDNDGVISLATRRRLAKKAYLLTAEYDAVISRWWQKTFDDDGEITPPRIASRTQALRYGENPHQRAAVHALHGEDGGVANATLVQGKPMSYNNLLDADAAVRLVGLIDAPAVAIIKHAMPCCCATGRDANDAYLRALTGDRLSAYGGIVALNCPITKEFAETSKDLFLEVIIAPEIDDDAIPVFAERKNLRILVHEKGSSLAQVTMRSISGGILIQDDDTALLRDLDIVSTVKPDDATVQDMKLAWMIARIARSNAIVLVKDGICIGVGQGQTSRIDAASQAIAKAKEHARAKGAILASDGFIPFVDTVEMATRAGIKAIIQPGGAKRDTEVLHYADDHRLVMAYTNMRHFRH
ncbi:MAG: bifunctional phosphoribosylaminoimidazolecarboxamide formyltransferase/IMP cyclohydrolase, partial [Pseudomonadota bacterium]